MSQTAAPPDTRPPSPFGPEHRLMSVGLLLGIVLIAFESIAVATALPAVARDLHGLKLYGWPLSAFFMGFMVGTVAFGSLADRDGPSKPLQLSLLLFALGLTVAGLAPNMATLIAGRVLQGLGGGGVLAVAYQVINTAYPVNMRARMLALISSAWVLPALLGPPVASFITDHWAWRGVFLGLLPLVLLAAALMLPPLRHLGAAGTPLHIGRLRAVLVAACGVTLLLAGITAAGRGEWAGTLALPAGLVLAWPALHYLFPAQFLRLDTPLKAGYAERFLLACAFFGTEAILPLGYAELRGVSLFQAGLALTAGSLTWAATSFGHSRLDERTAGRYRWQVVRFGAGLVATGLLGVWWGLHAQAPLWFPLLGWAITALGMGFCFPAHTLVVMHHAPEGQQGEVSGTLQLADMLGSALGAGVGGALIAAFLPAGGVPIHLQFLLSLALLASLLAVKLQERDSNNVSSG